MRITIKITNIGTTQVPTEIIINPYMYYIHIYIFRLIHFLLLNCVYNTVM